jgi:hypothetical protein
MPARGRIALVLFVVLVGVGCGKSAATTTPAVPIADDPDQAFAALQQRLLAARSIDVAVEVQSSAPYPSLLTGTLALRAGNQLELSVDGELSGQKVYLRLRAQHGRLRGGPGGDGDRSIDQPTPAALDEAVIIGLVRMGLLHNLALLSESMPPDHASGGAADWVVTTEHTWDRGRDETVEGRTARALAYQLLVAGQRVGEGTLWLDAQTGLPLKREVNVHFTGEGEAGATGTMHVSETYLKFEVTP